jgi:transcriptional regulator with XRE-family HTH domain
MLDRAMKRRAWTAAEVARRTGNELSGSSVLAYSNGSTLPLAASALAVAQTLDRDESIDLLRAWGYIDLAEAYAERTPETPVDSHRYSLEESSTVPAKTVDIGWKFEAEVVAISRTSAGETAIAKTPSGALLLVRPLHEFKGSVAFLDSLDVEDPDL